MIPRDMQRGMQGHWCGKSHLTTTHADASGATTNPGDTTDTHRPDGAGMVAKGALDRYRYNKQTFEHATSTMSQCLVWSQPTRSESDCT